MVSRSDLLLLVGVLHKVIIVRHFVRVEALVPVNTSCVVTKLARLHPDLRN